jgi:hypothetical protein
MTASISGLQVTVNLIKADGDPAGCADSEFELGKMLTDIEEL